MNKIKKQLAIIVLLSVFGIAFIGTASATVSLLQPKDALQYVDNEGDQITTATSQLTKENKSRAPEPATVALFGSGFMGMLVRFVRRSYDRFKRGFDIVMSTVALIVLSPLCLFVALLIKLTSKGPIFYKQIRVGHQGEIFEMFKFRTMKVDAEKDSGPVWARANDNRVTLIGKFLRKAHIDEIPQFINVIRGEMSIIGPRPERPAFVEKFKEEIPEYEKRLQVKPGITGLAQVWHRYDETLEDVKKKIKYDLLYIKKICLWTDIRILFRTVRVVITGEGAR